MKVREEDLAYRVALASVPSLGARTYDKLMERFLKMENVWRARTSELMHHGLTQKQSESLVRYRRVVSPDKLLAGLKKKGIQICQRGEVGYPPLLTQTGDGPSMVFVKTKWELGKLWQAPVVAVVGSRKPTRYGLEMTEKLVSGLVEAGVIIVSGLAFGIDSQAHQVCVRSGGVTVAVLPGGAGVVSPGGNASLAEKIVAGGGALLWEFGGEVEITRSSFPIRNRLVAGMSQAVLVVEGEERSGSMITPKMAADYGREVMAVPGLATSPRSAGPNSLIKQGAKMVTEVEDILEELGLSKEGKVESVKLTELKGPEKRVWLAYGKWGREVDRLVADSGVGVETVLGYLTEWELTGRV